MGGLHAKSMTSQRYQATYKMADMRYYGNVMTTTRWRLYVILHLQQYSRRLNFFNIFFRRRVIDNHVFIKSGKLVLKNELHADFFIISFLVSPAALNGLLPFIAIPRYFIQIRNSSFKHNSFSATRTSRGHSFDSLWLFILPRQVVSLSPKPQPGETVHRIHIPLGRVARLYP